MSGKADSYQVINRPQQRLDALEKVLGTAQYTADLVMDGMLYAALVRPKHPHARIIRIDTGAAERLEGVVCVCTAADVPGINNIGVAVPDQPLLAEEKVRHLGDGVAVVAATTREIALAAAELVHVEYEVLPVVASVEAALEPGAPLVHEDGKYGNDGNVLIHRHYELGNVDAAWENCDVIIENVYRTQHQEHAFIETECALAYPTPDGGVTVIGSLQCPFYVRSAVARVLGLSLNKVRIIQATVGGAFGGKEDVPSEICARAALLAVKTGRPVLKLRSREESMVIHTKRHPFIIRHKLGADTSGRLLAVEVDAYSDQGAYASVGPYVQYRATAHAAGAYDVPNVRVNTRLVYTNNVLTGAFRGFGQPQVAFSAEAQMDELARQLGLDPIEVRRKNIFHPGSVTHTGHNVVELDAEALRTVIMRAEEEADWLRRRKEYEAFNQNAETSGSAKRRGIGIASILYGVSLGREAPDTATSLVEIDEDGSVTFAHGGTEMGQGSMTALAMITAEEIGIPLSKVHALPTDTAFIQNSGPSVASRVTPVIGESVRRAASNAKRSVYEKAAEILGIPVEQLGIKVLEDTSVFFDTENATGESKPGLPFEQVVKACFQAGLCLVGVGHRRVAFDPEFYREYYTFSAAAHVAEVEVDIETGETTVLRVTAVNDVGRAINPQSVEGQIQGGVTQGLGLGLYEEILNVDGQMLNPNLVDYVIPTIKDVPEIRPIIVECADEEGPFGAKGIGEPSLIPTAAAVTNAVSHAIGKRVRRLPANAERVFRLIHDLPVEPDERPEWHPRSPVCEI